MRQQNQRRQLRRMIVFYNNCGSILLSLRDVSVTTGRTTEGLTTDNRPTMASDAYLALKTGGHQ